MFLRQFAPEEWDWGQKFATFMGPPFRVDMELMVGASAVRAHKEKYELLGGIANEYADRIHEDHDELNEIGYTPAARARSFAAITETLFAEQYAILDVLRRVVYSAFRGVRGIQNKSTHLFFERAAEHAYGSELPEPFRAALAAAYDSWFPKLRRLRTLITHGETGTCSMHRDTKVISYWHMASLRSGDKDVNIENVVEFGNSTYLSVVRLTEFFFQFLYLALEPVEHRVGCGIYKGRFYERMVAASPTLSFDDGRCFSHVWFETAAGYECPMREMCGAYRRPVPKDEHDAHFSGGAPSSPAG